MNPEGVPGELPADPVPSAQELASLYLVDSDLYGHTFFPDVMDMRSPPFHREIDQMLEDPRHRFVGLEVFRGGAKTTKLRVFTSKRIAYGISRTVLIVSSAQSRAVDSVRWIKQQVEYNKKWANFYGLSKGDKWTDEFIEIRHNLLGTTIAVIALGITGNIRGINIGGRRPDLIVGDDVDNEESTATPEQRKKGDDLFFGALAQSLTPASENPDAKMVFLQTSLHKEDKINRCHQDSTWETRKFGIFDEAGESRWPTRWTAQELRAEKQGYLDRGQILIWLREKECVVGDEETADFRGHWLKYWDMLPERMVILMSIDPAPPPSEAQLRRGLRDKDSEVISVQGTWAGEYYLLEQVSALDHDPEWTVTTVLALARKWQPIKIRVETVAYQQTLKHLIEKEMREKKTYFLVEEYKDRRKKRHRILQTFSGIASQGHLWVHKSQQSFVSEFSTFPNSTHDDHLDAAAIGFDGLIEMATLAEDEGMLFADEDAKKLPEWRPSP